MSSNVLQYEIKRSVISATQPLFFQFKVHARPLGNPICSVPCISLSRSSHWRAHARPPFKLHLSAGAACMSIACTVFQGREKSVGSQRLLLCNIIYEYCISFDGYKRSDELEVLFAWVGNVKNVQGHGFVLWRISRERKHVANATSLFFHRHFQFIVVSRASARWQLVYQFDME